MTHIRVVHLVWAPLGTFPLERFIRSYSVHPAGLEHRLLIVFNGFGADSQALRRARGVVADTAHDEVVVARPMLDLAVYRDVIQDVVAPAYLFCNSYSELLADGWLASLAGALDQPGAGLIGATGSWESGLTPVPWPLKPVRAPRFAAFPSPHVRTNAFAIPRELALTLRWPRARRKGAAWAIENGRHSLTRQVTERGLRARVVGRDGVAYESQDWPRSATFRAGEQSNLLVADNRTRDYEQATPERRRMLEQLAWGLRAP